jgi:tetratricopeptide (TPR) repeat protein
MQAFAALRADDPASAVRTFNAALAAPDEAPTAAPGEVPTAASGEVPTAASGEVPTAAPGEAPTAAPGEAPTAAPGEAPTATSAEVPTAAVGKARRREMIQGLRRARILAGDSAEPLAEAKALLDREDTAENRLDYALLLLAAQQNAAAREQLAELAQAPDSQAVALRLLGLLDFQEGKLADASARFAELVTTGKFLDDGLYYLALIAERHDDLERALRLYAQVQNGDNTVPALLRAATILRAHGAAPAAEELLDQLVNDEPQRAPEILAARAHIYSDAGDLPRAITVLEQAESQYPDSVELRYALASTSEEQGNVATALEVLKQVAALRPTDPAALNAYGYTLADHKRHLKAARKLIERAYAAAPKNAAILDSLGWVLFRQGHGAEALPYLDAAYTDEHDGDIAAHLGEVLWRLGRREDAERVWSAASVTDSDNHLLKATQQRLHASN